MAEFALGLTKTAVEGTLSRVKSAIEEEARLKETVQHDLVFITAEFQMMQSFLNVANKERAGNQVVRTWVRQLRDLAFDVEDCVEFVVHLDNKPAWWWRVVPSCMAPARHRCLDEAAAEIKLLKARVEEVSQRNTRYNLISDSGSHTKAVSSAEQPAPATANPSASVFPLLREVWDAAGRMSQIDDLQELITRKSSELKVISLWGSTGGDLGATFIFREAYYDKQIRQKFNSRVWIKLVHPFNRDEFLKSLMIQLCTSSRQATVGMEDLGTRMKAARVVTEEDLIKAEQLMKENRYLVVLEDVSTLAEWDAIKIYFPDCKNGSRIVLSTQDLGVALMCTGDPYRVSELRHFSHGQAICAFFKTVSSSRRRDMSELRRLIRRGGVISVHGRTRSKLELVKELIHRIRNIDEEQYFNCQFGKYRWVNVSNGLNRVDFLRRLHLDLDDDDDDVSADNDSDGPRGNEVGQDDSRGLQANEVAAVDLDLIEGCCKTLHEEDCLVVIDGLQSTEDWNWIKDTFLSQPIKGCVVVITNEEHVAKHCVEDEEYRAINCEYLEPKGRRMEEAHEWTNKFQLFGHDAEEELPSNRVTAVWGIAGIGKSDFVRNTYYNRILGIFGFSYVGSIFSYYSWVDVPHPFNLIEFSRRLLLDFHSDDIQAKEAASISIIEGQDPIQGCRDIMSRYSYLVVFDGLRSKDEWDLIKSTFLSELPWHSALSNIVVITNEAIVARYCVDNKDECVVNVKGLEAGEALRLFKKVLGPDKILTPKEMELSKHILAKCGGLPKVVVAIGKYCRRRNSAEDIKENFMNMLENDAEFDCLRALFSWMHSYFEDCNDSLKPCIFYLPIFPTNHNIRRRRLLRRWIAEGYSRDTSSGTAEENGERLFSELVDLSIIQQPSSKSMCRVNGFFHEYIISRPMEDNLVFALEGHCSLNSQLVGKHLTIRKSWDRDINVFENIDFSSLRSLTVFGEWKPFFVSTNNNMRLLRVLDLEDTTNVTDDDLEQIGKLLPRLKFLSLRGRKGITRLPNSLDDLRQLQTLDARHTSIAILPQGIIKLQKLQYIRAGTSKQPWNEGGRVISLTAPDYDGTLTPAQDDDGTPPSQHPAATAAPPPPPPPPPTEIEEGVGSNTSQPASPCVVRTSIASRHMPHTLLSSWFSKLCYTAPRLNSLGIEVPAGIGTLTALHTLGVVNFSGVGGKAIVMELKNLSRLRRLGVCGINQGNLKELCSAISGHAHLESLSVQVDKDEEQGLFCCFDDTISQPPKNLKTLKLYGYAHILPGSWMKHLHNLKRFVLEMTIFRQEDLHVLDELPNSESLGRLCVKLVQDVELHFTTPKNLPYNGLHPHVLEIDCTSKVQVSFLPPARMMGYVEVLKVHCSSGSSLRFSGLEHLKSLKEVWLKGSYGDELKEDLQQQLSNLRKKPILKLVQS